ncbi:MAG: cytochrome c peroxidase, partial [Dehalococcoidia bacterium]
DGTLSVIDTATNLVTATVVTTVIPLAPQVLAGKRLFNSSEAPRLSTDNWISCAVCHFDGTHDGRTWEGFPDGPRNTPSLLGVGETLPVHWSGDLDELADVELTVRAIQAGAGLTTGDTLDSLGPRHTGLSEDLDALAAFLGSLEAPVYSLPAGESVVSGRQVFENLGCDTCHAPPLFTDLQLHDVGTGNPALERNSHGRGTSFDTPSLRGLWRTAPYFHDGSATQLKDVLSTGTEHNVLGRTTAQEIDDLVAFLLALPVD